jgi:hypothetical protein
MNKSCSNCGREAKEGEMFTTFIDPNSDWWLTLLDKQYCSSCLSTIKQPPQKHPHKPD